jgi:hypothetical protein
VSAAQLGQVLAGVGRGRGASRTCVASVFRHALGAPLDAPLYPEIAITHTGYGAAREKVCYLAPPRAVTQY